MAWVSEGGAMGGYPQSPMNLRQQFGNNWEVSDPVLQGQNKGLLAEKRASCLESAGNPVGLNAEQNQFCPFYVPGV